MPLHQSHGENEMSAIDEERHDALVERIRQEVSAVFDRAMKESLSFETDAIAVVQGGCRALAEAAGLLAIAFDHDDLAKAREAIEEMIAADFDAAETLFAGFKAERDDRPSLQ